MIELDDVMHITYSHYSKLQVTTASHRTKHSQNVLGPAMFEYVFFFPPRLRLMPKLPKLLLQAAAL